MNKLSLSLLFIFLLTACGDDSDFDLSDGIINDEQARVAEEELARVVDDSTDSNIADISDGSSTAASSFLTGRIFMPDSSSGFQCQGAETRGGQTVCLLPYQYTLQPSYTKTDHNGVSFACNRDGETFDTFILDAAGTEYTMFIEENNPFGPQDGISDYFCANYVGTASGNVGRTHVRLTKAWDDFNGQSVSIKVCEGELCDTLILR